MKKEIRFFDLKMSLLFCWLFMTGLLMAVVGPADTLDIHLYYSFNQAQEFLARLSAAEVRAYQYNEFFDYMFMATYTVIFVMAMGKAHFKKRFYFLALIPGGLDMIETSVILRALFHPGKELLIPFLGWITFLKWFLGAALAIIIVMKYLYAKIQR